MQQCIGALLTDTVYAKLEETESCKGNTGGFSQCGTSAALYVYYSDCELLQAVLPANTCSYHIRILCAKMYVPGRYGEARGSTCTCR